MGFIIEIIKVIILGVIEGITEWLPISSTGHLILVDEFIKLQVSQEFKNMFKVVIQLGAILAVVVIFFPKLWPFSRNKTAKQRRDTITLWLKVIVGCIPAGLVGVLFNDWVDEHLQTPVIVSAALIIYGVLFIIIEKRNENRTFRVNKFSQLSYPYAIAIGLFQVLSLIPGTSRSGATILGGMLLGVSRAVSAEFSFFMSIPIMFGASFIKLIKFGFSFTPVELIYLLTGMVVAFIVSIMAIKFLMNYIKRNDFKIFGYYRIILGFIVLAYFTFVS